MGRRIWYALLVKYRGDTLVGALLRSATGRPTATYLSEKLWQPLGIEHDAAWLLDSSGNEFAGCCNSASARDFARVGLFALRGGVLGGKMVVPANWF